MPEQRLAAGTRRFIKRWMYAQLSILDGVMILLGKKNPKLSFTVLGDPNSLYINFEIKPSALDAFTKLIDLPEELELVPVRVLADEQPAYLLTLNIYEVSGLVSGSRAEWSTYVDDGDGKPRYMILEAQSSSGSMDPVNIVTRADTVEHVRNGMELFSRVDSGQGSSFTATIGLSDAQPMSRLANEWIGANDRIYWRNGIFDRAWYDASLFDSPVRLVSGKDIDIDDQTPWARFVKRRPRHVLRYESELQFMLSPWFNVT